MKNSLNRILVTYMLSRRLNAWTRVNVGGLFNRRKAIMNTAMIPLAGMFMSGSKLVVRRGPVPV